MSPSNKERLEYQEKLKFENGYDFTCWMQKVGIMKSPVEIDRKKMENVIKNAECINRKEYDDKKAQEIGFKDYADRRREQIKEWRHETGRSFPKELNEDWQHILESLQKIL